LLEKDAEIRKLLVIGIDATSVSLSASRGGFEVFGVDCFGDLDLKKYCKVSSSLREHGLLSGSKDLFTEEKMQSLVKIAARIALDHRIDGILLASGLEDYPEALAELQDLSQILGNTPEAIGRARDWRRLFSQMRRKGVLHPETEIAEDLEEAKKAAKDVGYPVLLKPSKGCGGTRISLARNAEELEVNCLRCAKESREILVQEYLQGIDASASVIATGEKAKVVCLTEQVIGEPRLGQENPFGWCGNTVPLDVSGDIARECISRIGMVVEDLGLIGSNGVDFILSDEGLPYVTEVNPRFQETIECIDRHLGTNLVKIHLDSCLKNKLPQNYEGRQFWTRLLLFASKAVHVKKRLSGATIRNVPPLDSVILKGDPICSVVVSGRSKITSLANAYRKIQDVKRLLSSP